MGALSSHRCFWLLFAQAESGAGTFKEQREAARRQTGGDRASWNALYMRPDTVMEAVAAQLGVTKSELLDSSHDDLAVRQALGEARVLAATKSALGDAGATPGTTSPSHLAV